MYDVEKANSMLALLHQQTGGSTPSRHLGRLGATVSAELWSRALTAPLQDFLGRRGKGFRARMVSFCWALSGRTEPAPEALGLIVEYIHAGSLIIDDIQDGSLERRGAPTLHRSYGMPLALCLGNWLYFFPFGVLADLGLGPDVELDLHRRMSTGMLRCHYGQALDLTVRACSVAQAELPAVVQTITDCKTGALFELAAMCGSVPAGADVPRQAALARFGAALGCALQHLDDLGTLRVPRHGSKRHEDLYGARATYAWALLAELLDPEPFAGFQARLRRCHEREESADVLGRDVLAVVEQEGMRRVRSSLDALLSDLRAATGPSEVLAEVEAELERLVVSYG